MHFILAIANGTWPNMQLQKNSWLPRQKRWRKLLERNFRFEKNSVRIAADGFTIFCCCWIGAYERWSVKLPFVSHAYVDCTGAVLHVIAISRMEHLALKHGILSEAHIDVSACAILNCFFCTTSLTWQHFSFIPCVCLSFVLYMTLFSSILSLCTDCMYLQDAHRLHEQHSASAEEKILVTSASNEEWSCRVYGFYGLINKP